MSSSNGREGTGCPFCTGPSSTTSRLTLGEAALALVDGGTGSDCEDILVGDYFQSGRSMDISKTPLLIRNIRKEGEVCRGFDCRPPESFNCAQSEYVVETKWGLKTENHVLPRPALTLALLFRNLSLSSPFTLEHPFPSPLPRIHLQTTHLVFGSYCYSFSSRQDDVSKCSAAVEPCCWCHFRKNSSFGTSSNSLQYLRYSFRSRSSEQKQLF